MADIKEAERVALENEIKGMFKRIGEHVVADIKAAKRKGAFMTTRGQAIIKGLKKEVTPELWDEIKDEIGDEIEAEVSKKAEKAVREVVERLFQIKGISVSDFTPLERMEMRYILKDFHL